MQTLGILPNLAEGANSQQDHVYTLKVQIKTEIMSASNRRHIRCLITQSDGTLHVGNARDSQGIDKIVEPEIVTKSVASLPRPAVPVFDVAPFNVLAPETISVLATEITPLMVTMSEPSDSNVTSPLKESEPAIATMPPLTVIASADSSQIEAAVLESGSSTDGVGAPSP